MAGDMDSSGGNYFYLIRKIDEFVRKYYLSRAIRGSLYLTATLLGGYIAITVAEYYGNFNELVRTLLFFGFLAVNILILVIYILQPLLARYRLSNAISHEQAAEIIGTHFSHIKDKLLNTLQLKRMADESPAQRALIEAGINQKIAELKPVPFTKAVNISENKKYLRYALPPLVVLLLIAFTAPSIFSEGTERIIHYNKKYVKKAPFSFLLLNSDLSVVQGDNLQLKLKMAGDEIPQDIYVNDGVNSFKLDKENIIHFSYTFRNLQSDKRIRFLANGYSSEEYNIKVKRKPSLLKADVLLQYPAYTGKKAETLDNAGDLTVPQGTIIRWQFRTGSTSEIVFRSNKREITVKPSGDNTFIYIHKAMNTADIAVEALNREVRRSDPAYFKLTVIPDLNPSIEVTEKPDSLNHRVIHFTGSISDDYGFSGLRFHYRKIGKDAETAYKGLHIPVDKAVTQSSFFYTWNTGRSSLKPGSEIEYFFEVSDNDGINGPKTARSAVRVFRMATEKEAEQQAAQSAKAVRQKIDQAIRQAAQIEKEAQQMNRQLLTKKDLSFEEKSRISDLLNKQKNLEELVNEIRKENQQNQLHEQKKEIIEKQKQIDDLFNNVLDEKTREILKNIERLLEENNKGQTQEELSKMQSDHNSVRKELDRILELYKQLEFEQNLSAAIEKLKELSEKQQELGRQTEKQPSAGQDILNRQDEISNEAEELQKDLDELEKKNAELEKKNSFSNPEQEMQQIRGLQQQGSKQLKNKQFTKASETMKQAGEQMKALSKKLEDMQQESEAETARINMQNLRQILANLLKSSFDQEKVMLALKDISSNDPGYIPLVRKQKDIRDNLKMVHDSLYSLSRQVPQLQSVVNKETSAVSRNIDKALELLEERRTPEANRDQQYAMTSINNLALMLSEVEEQLQRSMQNAQQGGKGKQKSLSQLSKMQEELNRNMEKARREMSEQGLQQGAKTGKGPMSEQMARMARQQQLIRQALQDINRDLNKDGKGSLGDLDKITKEMEQTETDIVNKTIRQETLLRQQQILTKLLEAEKAERDRETDTQRESKEAQDQTPAYNSMLEDYRKIKQKETELLKTVPPSLSLFYQLKIMDYFRNLDSK